MITSIIFSRNRPLQLDLCLKSIKANFANCNHIFVLEKYDNEYSNMLDILSTEHNDTKIFEQTSSIYRDCLELCLHSENDYICLFTDDDIVYRKINHLDCNMIFNESEFCTISLRLGLNITKRMHLNTTMHDVLEQYFETENYILVPKTTSKYGSYWSYSHSLDGHIFRKKDLVKIFDELCYLDKKYHFAQSPNEIETQMQRYWAITPNIIVCQKHSTVVNSPNNKVQNTHENLSGSYFDYSPEKLADLYKRGHRIEVNRLNFDKIECPHTEINILSDLYYDI